MDEQPDYVQRRRQYKHDWYVRNRDRLKEKARQYYWANHDEVRAKQRKTPLREINYQSAKSPEHRHRYYSEVLAGRNLRQKIRAFQVVSGLARPVCAECGESDIRVLTVNHLNGGGTVDLRGRNGVSNLRQAIIDGTRTSDDLNVLCFSCNIRYEYERGKRSLPMDWREIVEDEVRVYSEKP